MLEIKSIFLLHWFYKWKTFYLLVACVPDQGSVSRIPERAFKLPSFLDLLLTLPYRLQDPYSILFPLKGHYNPSLTQILP